DMRFLADDGKLTNLSERQKFPPYGRFGGKPVILARTLINPGPGEQIVHSKESREFAYGDVISFQQSGAGGYGDPLARDPARVLDDVLDDFIGIDAARSDYGVVITGTGIELRIDEEATRRLRASLKASSAAASVDPKGHRREMSTSSAVRYDCQPRSGHAFPGGTRPPDIYSYPPAPR